MTIFIWLRHLIQRGKRLYHAAHLVRLGLPWRDAWTVLGMVLESKRRDPATKE